MDTYTKAKIVNDLNIVYDYLVGIDAHDDILQRLDAAIGQVSLSGLKDMEKLVKEKK